MIHPYLWEIFQFSGTNIWLFLKRHFWILIHVTFLGLFWFCFFRSNSILIFSQLNLKAFSLRPVNIAVSGYLDLWYLRFSQGRHSMASHVCDEPVQTTAVPVSTHLLRFLTPSSTKTENYAPRAHSATSRGCVVLRRLETTFTSPLIKSRSSPEMSRHGREERAKTATGVQAQHQKKALQQVHESGRSQGAGRLDEGKLNNVARGACVALLNANISERAALEN